MIWAYSIFGRAPKSERHGYRMADYEFGKLAVSKAGHDKRQVYVIIHVDHEYVYLVDGKFRCIENPKRKNKKHVQIIDYIDENLVTKKADGTLNDEAVKRALKLFRSEEQKIRSLI